MIEFAKAFAKLQGDLKPALKDATNPHFRSRYADLSAIWDVIRAPLSQNGFGVIQSPQFDADGMWLETTLLHSSGDKVVSRYPLRPIKEDPQGFGSAITYAKRYALSAMLGVVADEDDDGNAATDERRIATNKAPATNSVTEDQDIIDGAKNWVEQQKEIILNCSNLDGLTNWLTKAASTSKYKGDWDRPAPTSALDKLNKSETLRPLFKELKAYYMEKLREV